MALLHLDRASCRRRPPRLARPPKARLPPLPPPPVAFMPGPPSAALPACAPVCSCHIPPPLSSLLPGRPHYLQPWTRAMTGTAWRRAGAATAATTCPAIWRACWMSRPALSARPSTAVWGAAPARCPPRKNSWPVSAAVVVLAERTVLLIGLPLRPRAPCVEFLRSCTCCPHSALAGAFPAAVSPVPARFMQQLHGLAHNGSRPLTPS